MQKKLIALAIAGLSSAAFAQSNVTVYGQMALAQESVKADGSANANNDVLSRGRLASNTSVLGFKGSEALGNGLTAVFQLETTVTPDRAAATAIGGRDSFVGIAGGFGTVLMGTLTHPMRALGAKVDNNGGAGIGFTASMYGKLGGVATGTDDRATDAVAYVSPNFSGLTGVVAYVNGENRTNFAAPASDNVDTKAWQVGLNYEQGPLFVGFAHHNAEDPTTVAVVDTDSKFKANRFAAIYTIGATRLSALWDQQKATFGNNVVGGNNDVKRTAWMVGASHTFGANQIYLQYAKAKDLTGTLVTGVSDTGSKQVTLGYNYSLSKRTTVQAYYSKITNKTNAGYDFYNNATGITSGVAGLVAGVATSQAADPKGYGLGLKHTF